MSSNSSNVPVIVTSCGVAEWRESNYRINEEQVLAPHPSFALYRLLQPKFCATKIYFVLTREAAEKHWESIKTEADRLGVDCEKIEVADGDDSTDTLESIAKAVPADAEVVLDVTQGLRHHAFLFYGLAVYLSSFQKTEVTSAWYCRHGGSSEASQFVDLSNLLKLNQWFQGMNVFEETGSLRKIAELFPAGDGERLLSSYSKAFSLGLPVELGNCAKKLRETIQGKGWKKNVRDVPLSNQIKDKFLKVVDGFQSEGYTKSGKSSVLLDEKELQRQADVVSAYIEFEQYNLAFGLMREWVVSYCCLKLDAGENWLDRDTRFGFERKLGAIDVIVCDPKKEYVEVRDRLTVVEKKWAERWSNIRTLRNQLQHHGMAKADFFVENGKVIKRVIEDWRDRESWGEPPRIGGGKGKLLICPVGKSKGVLLSAIAYSKPDRCIVLRSKGSNVDFEATSNALENISMPEIVNLELENPHSGFNEFPGIYRQLETLLFEADEVFVSLTGGTSVMGILAERISQRSKLYLSNLTQFVLVDERDYQDQQDNPWVVSKAVPLARES